MSFPDEVSGAPGWRRGKALDAFNRRAGRLEEAVFLDDPNLAEIALADIKALFDVGRQVRDWIHITDIVGAVQEALRQDIIGPVNLGSGEATTFNQLATMVCDKVGYNPRRDHRLDAPQGVMYRCSDNSRMLEFYRPRISLEQGIDIALSG